jgi:hypothetical protein
MCEEVHEDSLNTQYFENFTPIFLSSEKNDSGQKITLSLGYVTLSGEGKMERATESKMAACLH